jgi:hypothetical protein
MLTRLRHRHFVRSLQETHNGQNEQLNPLPIYDAIAHALYKWNLRGLTTGDDFAYEAEVVWLLQHLPTAFHRNEVDNFLKERFATPQGSPEKFRTIASLADDLWHAWRAYLHRSGQSPFTHARARGLMTRHYSPQITRH